MQEEKDGGALVLVGVPLPVLIILTSAGRVMADGIKKRIDEAGWTAQDDVFYAGLTAVLDIAEPLIVRARAAVEEAGL